MKHELRLGNRTESYELWLWPENEEERFILHLLAQRSPITRATYDGHVSYKKVTRLWIEFPVNEDCQEERPK